MSNQRWWNAIVSRTRFGFAGVAVFGMLCVGLVSCGPNRSGGTGLTSRSARAEEASREHLNAGREALAAGDMDTALQAFSEAIEENPQLYEAHLGIGDIHRQSGDYDTAETSYRNAAELNPRSYEANYYHGLMLHLLDRVAEAIRAYRAALVIDPHSHDANLNLATAYFQEGLAEEALPFGEAAVRVKSDHGPTHVNLGSIYAALDRHEDAIRHYERALELMDATPELILNLVESLRKVRRYSEMINALEALIRMDPTPAAYERLGYAQFRVRNYNASANAYRDALDVSPDYYPAMNGLAVNLLNRYLQSEKTDKIAYEEAISYLRASLRVERDQPRITDLLTRYAR